MLRVTKIEAEPLHELRYLNANRRGGTDVCRLAIERARAEGLPDALDALVVTSDLQGVVPAWARGGEATLLGVAVAEALEQLADSGDVPALARAGAILAGDLYSVPEANKRGGHGSVADVWQAFADRFAWVAGVAGNHDDVSDVRAGHLLDGASVELDGLTVGGVGLIIGNPDKRGRRGEDDQLALIEDLAGDVDVLVLHEGPHGADPREQLGNAAIRDVIDALPVPLVVCGHCHWDVPLADYKGGQILNVDTRVLVITR